MARPREFDLDSVLLSALETFAAHGYEGTSIDQLVVATGLQRGSLYQAFGSKAGLFREVLATLLTKIDDSKDFWSRMEIDFLIVSFWERSRNDAHIRDVARKILSKLATRTKRAPAQILYRQIMLRAGITK